MDWADDDLPSVIPKCANFRSQWLMEVLCCSIILFLTLLYRLSKSKDKSAVVVNLLCNWWVRNKTRVEVEWIWWSARTNEWTVPGEWWHKTEWNFSKQQTIVSIGQRLNIIYRTDRPQLRLSPQFNGFRVNIAGWINIWRELLFEVQKCIWILIISGD